MSSDAVTQRRQGDRDHCDAEIQILPKLAFGDRAGEILVGGRHDPDIDADGARPADALDLLGLDGAQQLGLRLGPQVADFVQEERPRVGQLESADAAVGGARERAALVSEHSALDEVARNRGAVDPHERSISSPAARVNGGGDELLAGP